MPGLKANWEKSLSVTVHSDDYVSGRHGFELFDAEEDPGDMMIFESGMVYSTRHDAEQAGDDAAHAAWKWRNM